MSLTNVAVLRGGPSEEYDVSLETGAHVLSSLNRERYRPIDIVITQHGEWLLHGRARTPYEAVAHADVVVNALHGAYGEDGTVARLLERIGVPYTGSAAYPSALAMNKAIAKDHLRHHGIKLARHMVVGRSALSDTAAMARSIKALFGPEYVVKPIASGSSRGVYTADSELALAHALYEALVRYEQVLVEERIHGREATVGVIDGFRGVARYALPPVEIATKPGAVFDYETKYGDGSLERCPSSFPLPTIRELERLAVRAHEVLGLRHYSRSDFMVARDGIYYLETNTLPGLTRASLFPKALAAVGSSMPEFLDHILTHAREGAAQPVR